MDAITGRLEYLKFIADHGGTVTRRDIGNRFRCDTTALQKEFESAGAITVSKDKTTKARATTVVTITDVGRAMLANAMISIGSLVGPTVNATSPAKKPSLPGTAAAPGSLPLHACPSCGGAVEPWVTVCPTCSRFVPPPADHTPAAKALCERNGHRNQDICDRCGGYWWWGDEDGEPLRGDQVPREPPPPPAPRPKARWARLLPKAVRSESAVAHPADGDGLPKK